MTRSRICFVLPSLNGGGAERAAVHILNQLPADRWDRSMFLFKKTGPYLDELDPAITLASADGGDRTAEWQALRAFVKRTRPQIVVSFLSYFSVLTAVRAAGVGACVVFNQQTPMSAFLEDGDYPWRRGWRRGVFSVATRAGYGQADLIITTSKGVADDLVTAFGVRRDKIEVVPNPVDLETVKRSAPEPIDPAHEAMWKHPVIVAAGRLAEAKNYPLLIDAFAELRNELDARLFILGTGELEPKIRGVIHERGLEDSIVLCGFQKNPWKYIAKADVFALSSKYEGFGNVLIEAMACGVPVVATASAGTRDIVQDDHDGLLVEHHDAASFAGALSRVLGDARLRAGMSAAASQSATRFESSRVAATYDSVFTRMLA